MTFTERESLAAKAEEAARSELAQRPDTTYADLVVAVARSTDSYLDEIKLALASRGVYPAANRGVVLEHPL